MSQILRRRILSIMFTFSGRYSSGGQAGEWGSGAGKGGGAGGAVREAGGAFGKMEAAREEEYFRKLQKEQIQKLKGHLDEEIAHHEDSIKRLQEEIARHKKKISELASSEETEEK